MKRLTNEEYWNNGYIATEKFSEIIDNSYKNWPDKQLIDSIESLNLVGKKILEIGAGNSSLLLYLAKKHKAEFWGLDYSEAGCELLKKRAQSINVNINVIQQDFFCPNENLLNNFDIVYSIGVVEHFEKLDSVLAAKKIFLKPNGKMFTLIPNMAGIIGTLTRRYNKDIYKIHNPHDINSFVQGHSDANLTIDCSGYLCSNNFGVLSSCFHDRSNKYWKEYVLLTRISKLSWLFEKYLFNLPKSAYFSPYIYIVSRK